MFELLYTSEVMDIMQQYTGSHIGFMKNWVCARVTGPTTETYPYSCHFKLFHDGTLIPISIPPDVSIHNICSRVRGRLCSLEKYGTNLCCYEVDEWLGIDQGLPLTSHISQVYPGDPFVEIPWAGVSSKNHQYFIDDDLGILLLCWSAKTEAYDTTTGEKLWTLNYSALATYPTTSTQPHWVKSQQIMVAYSPNGLMHFIYYDRSTAVVLFSGKIDPCRAITYDCVNGVIMALGYDAKMRIYYPRGVPDHFVGPTISTPIYRGRSYTVTAQLLGANNEPCEGWWLNWRLLNGKGSLAKEHTLTDATGTAANLYIAPLDELQLGSEEIIVEVVT